MSKNRRYSSLALLLISSAVLGAIRVGYWHPSEQIIFDISPSILDQDLYVQGSHTPTSSGSKAITGEISVAVVAVEFEDKHFTLTLDQLAAIFSQRLRKYVEEISYKRVTLRCNVQGIIRLAQTMRSYGRDAGNIDGEGGGIRTYKLIQDAVEKADQRLFKDCEYLVIMHAGEGQESTPTETDNIWSVAYLLGVWFRTANKSYDKAALVPEKQGRGADVLGVVAHEFLHLLGLPDLYNPRSDMLQGEADKWDVMARGTWNGAPAGSRPAHPTAWSKIQLGWIETSSIKEVRVGESATEYISPVEASDSDLKAVKIPLTKNEYYLVELRSRIYDPSLPNDGILVTRIEDGIERSGGIVTIVCSKPGLSNATFKLGNYFLSKAENVLIAPRYCSNATYGIDILRGKFSAIKISVPSGNSPFYIDGKPCSPFPDGTTTVFVTPVAHKILMPNHMAASFDRTRIVFQSWSDGNYKNDREIQASNNVSLSVKYKVQTMLTIKTIGIPNPNWATTIQVGANSYSIHDSAKLELWMDLDRTVPISIEEQAEAEQGVRYVFKEWTNTYGTSTTISLPISRPTELAAKFGKQYRLIVRSQFGNPAGQGWYDEGTKVKIQVSSPHLVNERERCIFECWSGDYRSNEPSCELLVDKPGRVTAQWRKQYLTRIDVIDSHEKPLRNDILNLIIQSADRKELNPHASKDTWLDDTLWKIKSVSMMGVSLDLTEQTFVPSNGPIWIIRVKTCDLTITLSSRFLFIRIPDASMHLRLPSGMVSDERTDRNGATTFYSLPPGRYELSAIRDTETIFNTAIDLQNDTNIWIKVADPFENMIIAVCIVAAISAAGIIIYRLKPRRTRLEHSSPEVDTRVYDYVALNQGIISKSRASVDLRIPQDALNQAISRLVHSGRLSSG